MAWAWVFMQTNNATNTADSDLGTIVVLRHDAIAAAMEDRLWAKYKFGEVFKIDDPGTKKPALKNVYINPAAGGFRPLSIIRLPLLRPAQKGNSRADIRLEKFWEIREIWGQTPNY